MLVKRKLFWLSPALKVLEDLWEALQDSWSVSKKVSQWGTPIGISTEILTSKSA